MQNTEMTYHENMPLKFWFCENPRLALPLVSIIFPEPSYLYHSIGFDYDTFFINELFTEQYNEYYEMTEQCEYIKVYESPYKIDIKFKENNYDNYLTN